MPEGSQSDRERGSDSCRSDETAVRIKSGRLSTCAGGHEQAQVAGRPEPDAGAVKPEYEEGMTRRGGDTGIPWGEMGGRGDTEIAGVNRVVPWSRRLA